MAMLDAQPLHHVVIRSRGPRDTTVTVDGQDITKALHSVSIDLEAGSIAQVQLGLFVGTWEVDGEARVHIPDDVRDALLALGWTPPDTCAGGGR